jgi:hypothetical protein
MLTDLKRQKLSDSLKNYFKRFLNGSITDLDESGTRIMINHFLTDVLGYIALEEVRTEYMIKGTYADYMVQMNGKRHFLVEVKAFSLNLNDSHLRQAINYGANEGVDWALLTNGKQFDFYKIHFEKPIHQTKVFSVVLNDPGSLKNAAEILQFLTKDAVTKGGLDVLWNKSLALTPKSIAKILLCPDVVSMVKKSVNKSYTTKFDDQQIQDAIFTIISDKIDIKDFKLPKLAKKEAGKKVNPGPDVISNVVATSDC